MVEMKLLPCPFCGDAAHLTSGGPLNEYVKCFGCGVSTDDSSKERAIAAWNRRPPLLEAGNSAVSAWNRRSAEVELAGELRRMVDHFSAWANDHADEATCETWAALHCARDALSKAGA